MLLEETRGMLPAVESFLRKVIERHLAAAVADNSTAERAEEAVGLLVGQWSSEHESRTENETYIGCGVCSCHTGSKKQNQVLFSTFSF